MAKPDTWMAIYWADFLADTLHLQRAEIGSYMLLIGAYWRNGGPLEDNTEQLRLICRCDAHDWARVRGTLAKFFVIQDGKWTHKRIDKELAKSKEKYARRLAQTEAARQSNPTYKRGPLVTSLDTSLVTDLVTSVQPQGPLVTSLDTSLVTDLVTSVQPQPQPQYNKKDSTPCTMNMVELPMRFPRGEKEAIEAAAGVGATEDTILKAYTKALSRGGRDAKGQAILNWPAYVALEAKYERERLHQAKPEPNGSHSPRSYWELKSRLDLVAAEIKAIEDRSSANAFGIQVSAQDKPAYAKLKAERKSLKKELGLAV